MSILSSITTAVKKVGTAIVNTIAPITGSYTKEGKTTVVRQSPVPIIAAAVGVSAPAATISLAKTIAATPAAGKVVAAVTTAAKTIVTEPKKAITAAAVVGVGIPTAVGLLSSSAGRSAVSSIPSKAAAAGADVGKVLGGEMSIVDFAKENKGISIAAGTAAVVGLGAVGLAAANVVSNTQLKSALKTEVKEKELSSNAAMIPTGAITPTSANSTMLPSVVPVSVNTPKVTKTTVKKRKVYKPKGIIPINNRINNNIQVNVRR